MASNNPNFKTSVCKYAYVGCKQQKNCWYAHNKNELRQRYCVNSNKCCDQTCCYLHPNQSIDKDEYYLKVLLKSDVLGIDKNIIKRHINDKFIIEIENEDYENNEDENNEDENNEDENNDEDKDKDKDENENESDCPTNDKLSNTNDKLSNNNDKLSNNNDKLSNTDTVNEIDNDNNMDIDDLHSKRDDSDLKNYIEQFTLSWNASTKEFYEIKDDKIWKNMNLKVNETQLQIIMKYLQNTNIEFNFEK